MAPSLSMNEEAATALNSRSGLRYKSCRKSQKEGTLKTCCEVVKHLMETNATNDKIAETDALFMRFTQ